MRRNEREVTEYPEIKDIISNSDVCRIAFTDKDAPYIVTMNFGFEGDPVKRLFFHCAPEGRKMELLKQNNKVCFEMDIDHHLYTGEKGCNWGMKYRSVVGYGNMTILKDNDDKKTGMDRIMEHYGGKNEYTYDARVFERTIILVLEITEITAKKC